MTRPSKPADPTAERTSEMSTQTGSGLSGGKPVPSDESAPDAIEDPIRRTSDERDDTPRGYDRTDDPVMPADDPELGTKI